MLACAAIKLVGIEISYDKNSVLLTVSDSGVGITPEVLSRLGEKGFSTRVNSRNAGSGRGIYAAKKVITEIGGDINYESQFGLGTKVTLKIPAEVDIEQGRPDLILIDNEEMIRLTWEICAAESGFTCRTFTSVAEFLLRGNGISKEIPVFIDSDLDDGEKGQDAAPGLFKLGYEQIFLTTAYAELHGVSVPFINTVIGKQFSGAEKILRTQVTNAFKLE